jgi:regulator of sigma E protease
MLAVLVFIIILGVLIFVHELGHFTVARRNGIKASEFGFGFPPRAVGFQYLYEDGKKKKWRIVWGNKDGDDENEKQDLEEAHKKKFKGGTIYSLNWIPLGGFVKIKGEDGGNKDDEDSFASKSGWIRTKVLAAGVMMNFMLAWILISIVFMLGAPQAFDPSDSSVSDAKIQISEVAQDSPANLAGINIGDEVFKSQTNPAGEKIQISSVKEVQDYIKDNAGKEISLTLIRGKETLELTVTPRENAPEGEGLLGVNLAQTKIIRYVWYQAFWEGLRSTYEITLAILVALGGIIKSLFMGQGVGADVAGPVGIAVLTKQVTGLGIVYVLQFAALLSINLGIINILPIPALDGGRILFVLIEKIKGKPVSQKIEQAFHSVGFMLLILLLVLITFKDVAHYVK